MTVSAATTDPPAPSPLVTVALGGGTLQFWPYTGGDFSGTPGDPINLIFLAPGGPRAVRASLMMLDGDRTAFEFPAVFPFTCVWKDAIGGMQTAYATGSGWTGSAVQLECGDYGPVRFHLRLFGAGEWTLANAHFEVLIPGTTEHQVVSWELAEQLVAVDFRRAGLLDQDLPLLATDPINPSPFREIPAVIYSGLPGDLRAAIGGPLADQSAPVAIASDGRATALNVAARVEGEPVVARQDFVIAFDQVIPRPFCAGQPGAFFHVVGPVRLRQQVVLNRAGDFHSQFHAIGHLEVTPLEPGDGGLTPVGESARARVVEHHKGILTDAVTLVSSFQMQTLLGRTGEGRGWLGVRLDVGPGASSHYSLEERCS
ncbi:MAG TPA: hypothetical protein VNI61_04550 [Gemmatimonadales bacterium]|nr:hypothetical protein [Gemmatimonadales bacterium]